MPPSHLSYRSIYDVLLTHKRDIGFILGCDEGFMRRDVTMNNKDSKTDTCVCTPIGLEKVLSAF